MVTQREWVTGLRKAVGKTNGAEIDRQENVSTDETMTSEVLETSFTEEEFEAELEKRESVLKDIENSVVRHAKKYEQFLQQAVEKNGDRKVRYLLKAKEQQLKHDIKNEIYDNLMRQQLFLVKLLLHDKKQKMRDAGQNWDFNIDISQLPVDDIVDDIESESDQAQVENEVIEEIEMAMDLGSDGTLGIDLSDIESEAEELEAADIADKALDVDSSLEEDIDDRIQDELAGIDNLDLNSDDNGDTNGGG
jgi:hypothetical protein